MRSRAAFDLQLAGEMTLTGSEIPVWWMATETVGSADLHRWLELLDEEERERSSRFRSDIDRREFIAAHALLRSMLSCYANCPAQQWTFTRGADGKPIIEPRSFSGDLHFNLTHTQGLVAAAVTSHGGVGIDAERIDPVKADLAMAEHYFAPAELRALQGVPVEERTTYFFRLWSLKEAYLKAVGTGLGTPLNSFAFLFQPIRIEFAPGVAGRADWQFAILPTTAEHVLSVAVGRQAGADVRIASRAVFPQNF